MEPESPQSAVPAGSKSELRRAARAEVDALVRSGALARADAGLRGARISLGVCAVLAAIGVALGSGGVPAPFRSPSDPTRPDPVETRPGGGRSDFEPRVFSRGSGLAKLRDEAFAAMEDGDPARARRAAAKFLLRPREATPGLRAERPDLWRILGEALRAEALESGSPPTPEPATPREKQR